MNKLHKAVFPVAGFGTRFLQQLKAMPKELLPIIDKPLIQYAAEEAIAAGIDTLIFVTGRNKRAIEDHFDNNQELEAALRAKGKYKLIWLKIFYLQVLNASLCVNPNSLALVMQYFALSGQ